MRLSGWLALLCLVALAAANPSLSTFSLFRTTPECSCCEEAAWLSIYELRDCQDHEDGTCVAGAASSPQASYISSSLSQCFFDICLTLGDAPVRVDFASSDCSGEPVGITQVHSCNAESPSPSAPRCIADMSMVTFDSCATAAIPVTPPEDRETGRCVATSQGSAAYVCAPGERWCLYSDLPAFPPVGAVTTPPPTLDSCCCYAPGSFQCETQFSFACQLGGGSCTPPPTAAPTTPVPFCCCQLGGADSCVQQLEFVCALQGGTCVTVPPARPRSTISGNAPAGSVITVRQQLRGEDGSIVSSNEVGSAVASPDDRYSISDLLRDESYSVSVSYLNGWPGRFLVPQEAVIVVQSASATVSFPYLFQGCMEAMLPVNDTLTVSSGNFSATNSSRVRLRRLFVPAGSYVVRTSGGVERGPFDVEARKCLSGPFLDFLRGELMVPANSDVIFGSQSQSSFATTRVERASVIVDEGASVSLGNTTLVFSNMTLGAGSTVVTQEFVADATSNIVLRPGASLIIMGSARVQGTIQAEEPFSSPAPIRVDDDLDVQSATIVVVPDRPSEEKCRTTTVASFGTHDGLLLPAVEIFEDDTVRDGEARYQGALLLVGLKAPESESGCFSDSAPRALSDAAIAGIILGALVLFGVIFGVLIFRHTRKEKSVRETRAKNRLQKKREFELERQRANLVDGT